ncbi:MAG TPA: hypothetical protein VHK65_04500 [Candidatus Dormibacteraeota bacterium]|nr:hypothetical protein [Candidatus Dormibacteraeota bacterium]
MGRFRISFSTSLDHKTAGAFALPPLEQMGLIAWLFSQMASVRKE